MSSINDTTTRDEIAEGLRYTHSRANSNTAKLLEVSSFAYAAVELLAEKGLIDIEVLDLRSLLPFDREAVLESVKKTSKVILLHEDTQIGGFAGELAAIIAEEAFEYLDGPIRRITAPNTPVPYSPPLEEFFLPKVSDVVRVARELYAY